MNKLFIITLALFFTLSLGATPSNCKTAGTGDTCSVCSDNYGLNAAKTACNPCPTGCTTGCDVSATNTDNSCNCAAGTGLKNTLCTKCTVANCNVCSRNADLCETCKDGYATSDDKKTCTACTNNCKTCTNVDDFCDACPTGFTTPNKTTADAPFCCNSKDCVECATASKCTKCSGSIKLDEDKGTCFGFKTGASLTLGAIVSVALFSLLF